MNYKTVEFKRVNYPHENKMRTPTLENDYIYVCVYINIIFKLTASVYIIHTYCHRIELHVQESIAHHIYSRHRCSLSHLQETISNTIFYTNSILK